MMAQQMFAEEQRIRGVLGRFRGAVQHEQDRFHAYRTRNAGAAKALEEWAGRITVYTEACNLLAEYLTDYAASEHGVLKYLRQAEEEARVAKTNLLYMDQLHAKKAQRDAVELAEQLAYSLMGDAADQLEPQLRKAWAAAVDEELALYERMVQERGNGHA